MNINPNLSQKEQLRAFRELKRDLIGKVREVEKNRNELKEKRDSRNKDVKNLFQEAKETREKRDLVNEDVKLNKALRDLRQEDVTKVINELEKLEEEMKEFKTDTNFKKNNRHSKIEKRIQNLERTYVTTGRLTPAEEKDIIEQIEKLTKEKEKLDVVEGKRDEFRAINKKLRKLRSDALSHHKEVQQLAQASQDYHEVMIGQLKEAKQIRAEADADHKQVIVFNEEIKQFRKQINKVANESDKIRKLLGEETAVERKKRKFEQAKQQEQDISEKANVIYKRYKAGAKLGFEEFKILVSRGMLKD